jgi:hypothetical protein
MVQVGQNVPARIFIAPLCDIGNSVFPICDLPERLQTMSGLPSFEDFDTGISSRTYYLLKHGVSLPFNAEVMMRLIQMISQCDTLRIPIRRHKSKKPPICQYALIPLTDWAIGPHGESA